MMFYCVLGHLKKRCIYQQIKPLFDPTIFLGAVIIGLTAETVE